MIKNIINKIPYKENKNLFRFGLAISSIGLIYNKAKSRIFLINFDFKLKGMAIVCY